MSNDKIIEVSHDDRRWYDTVDLDGLEQFLANPRTWLETNVGVKLADSYVIQIKSNAAENKGNSEIDIVGTASLIGNDVVSKAILVRFHRQSVMQAMRWAALAEGEIRNVLPTFASRWPEVTQAMAGKVSLDLTFRPRKTAGGGLDYSAGQVYPHFEMFFDRTLIAKYVVAIVSEPEGFNTFYGSLPVQNRRVWHTPGNIQAVSRGSTGKEVYNPLDQNIDILIEGDDVAGCPDSTYVTVACSSDSGSYTGNPSNPVDTVIDIEDIMLKPYCIKKTETGVETFEARSVWVNP